MTSIQTETALLQTRAETLAAIETVTQAEKDAGKIAQNLCKSSIPAFERVRATAEIELNSPGGLSELVSDNYHNMLSGIESQFGEGYSVLYEDDNHHYEDWFNGVLQSAKIHTWSRIASGIEPSGYPEPPAFGGGATEGGGGGKTKWPPGPC